MTSYTIPSLPLLSERNSTDPNEVEEQNFLDMLKARREGEEKKMEMANSCIHNLWQPRSSEVIL
jgi:hypothetical protein